MDSGTTAGLTGWNRAFLCEALSCFEDLMQRDATLNDIGQLKRCLFCSSGDLEGDVDGSQRSR